MNKMLMEKVGKYCKNFRIDIFEMSLTDFCERTNSNIKNISAFEHGRANNIGYLYLYYNECNEREKEVFARGLFRCI